MMLIFTVLLLIAAPFIAHCAWRGLTPRAFTGLRALVLAGMTAGMPTAGGAADVKLIHFGWDNPNLADLPQAVPKLRGSVFDGLTAVSPEYSAIFKAEPSPAESDVQEFAALKSVDRALLANSYIVVYAATDGVFDWRNDAHWSATRDNARKLARLARAGGFKGLVIDMEPYGKSPWDFRTQAARESMSFAEMQSLVLARGQNLMETLEAEYPGLDVWNLYGLSAQNYLLSDPASITDPEKVLAEDANSLWPAFLGGMIMAASPEARVIDGNESAYYYTTANDFARGVARITQELPRFLPAPAKAAYARKLLVGHAVYVDGIMNLHASPRFIGHYFKTDADRLALLTANTANAILQSQSLVWIYTEKAKWWSAAPDPDIEAALRGGKAEADAGRSPDVATATELAEAAWKQRVVVGGRFKGTAQKGTTSTKFSSDYAQAACTSYGDHGEYACEIPKGSSITLEPVVEPGLRIEPARVVLKNVEESRYDVDWEIR